MLNHVFHLYNSNLEELRPLQLEVYLYIPVYYEIL